MDTVEFLMTASAVCVILMNAVTFSAAGYNIFHVVLHPYPENGCFCEIECFYISAVASMKLF